MRLLVILGKILLIPLFLVVTVAQFFLCFLVGCSSGILNFLSGLLFLGAVVFLIAQETKLAMTGLLVGFFVFMIPVLGEGIVIALALLQKKMIALVRGE